MSTTNPAPQIESDDPIDHVLPFMRGMNKPWDAIGYCILGLAVVVALLWIFAKPIAPTGKLMPNSKLPDVELVKTPLAMLTVFLTIFSDVATFLWILADIVDRRSKYIWLMPLIPFGYFGLHAIPLGLYHFFGRIRSK